MVNKFSFQLFNNIPVEIISVLGEFVHKNCIVSNYSRPKMPQENSTKAKCSSKR